MHKVLVLVLGHRQGLQPHGKYSFVTKATRAHVVELFECGVGHPFAYVGSCSLYSSGVASCPLDDDPSAQRKRLAAHG